MPGHGVTIPCNKIVRRLETNEYLRAGAETYLWAEERLCSRETTFLI